MSSSSKLKSGVVIVPLRSGSDGDATHRPDLTTHTLNDPPTLYLEKIGQLWMEARGEALSGIKYILQKLPHGYTCYEKPRPFKEGSPKRSVDRWLFGHPQHRVFDSPNRFFPHFKYLMDHDGDSMGCTCSVCQGQRGGASRTATGFKKPQVPASASSSRSASQTRKEPVHKPLGRPKLNGPGADTGRVDEEGTPDVYRNLIDKLKRVRTLDEPIKEPLSMDWRCEQEIQPELLQKFKQEPQWLPRMGDLVLFIRKLNPEEEICREDATGHFKVYNTENHRFTGYPRWEAGVVGQPPAEAVTIEDFVIQTDKKYNVNSSGIRVEPLPDPNGTDKSLSKQYKYVPLHYTRPFVFWKEFLGPIPEEEWHPTIRNALTVMSTFSLMGKHRFSGTWPTAKIFVHGIYIGSEQIVVGDIVRVKPKNDADPCTDIVQITSIQLKLTNLDLASDNDYDEGRPYNSKVEIYGKALTLNPSRTHANVDPKDKPHIDKPTVIDGYPPWYPLHASSKFMMVHQQRILGRCFESDAMILWFCSNFSPTADINALTPNLSEGLAGLIEAREYARTHDKRITEDFGRMWFWGEHRAETLGVNTINGVELGDRDPKTWRKWIKTIEEHRNEEMRVEKKNEGVVGRGLRAVRAYLAPSAKKGGVGSGTATSNGSKSTTRESSVVPRKRSLGSASRPGPKVINLSSDSEEDEDEKSVVKTDAQKKKPRVMVVIDKRPAR